MRAIRSGCLTALVATLMLSGVAVGQDVPYEQHYPLRPNHGDNVARLVVHPGHHPEVAVSRSLAAQPVHPHMAKLQLAGQHTWIDPYRDYDADSRLDGGHTLIQARNLYFRQTGVSTRQLEQMRANQGRFEAPFDRPNRASLVVSGERDPRADGEMMDGPQPIMVIPAPDGGEAPRSIGEPTPLPLAPAEPDAAPAEPIAHR